jgi:hypothetical protein
MSAVGIDRSGALCFSSRHWGYSAPLAAERLARNVRALRNGVANVLIEVRYVPRKLDGNACDKITSIADVSAAS